MESTLYDCFLIVPTGTYKKVLRRFSCGDVESRCPVTGFGYHDVAVVIEDDVHVVNPIGGDVHPHEDERWPTVCHCDYVFGRSDPWQLFWQAVYKNELNGMRYLLDSPPIGAMWRTEGYDIPSSGSDGTAYVVQTPFGPWALGRGGFNVLGTPPKVTIERAVMFSWDDDQQIAYSLHEGVLRIVKVPCRP